MPIQIPKMYPTSALTIHLCGKEITLERMGAMFKEVGTPFLPKLAANYLFTREEMERILSFAGSAPSQTVEVEEKKEVAPKEEEKEEEKDEDVAFDDFFD